MAYRTADHLRWQQMNFVIGIEIRTSNHHPAPDICDDLKGRYPKDFKFVGWHPQCRCHAVPILSDLDEMIEWGNQVVAGEADIDSYQPEQISDAPQVFTDWLSNNRERAKGWETTPYFIRDNLKYSDNFVTGTYTPAEKKFTRARRTKAAMVEALGGIVQRIYLNISNTEKAAIFHYTRGDIPASRQLNKQLRDGKLNDFNVAFSELLSNALAKIEPVETTVYRTMRLNRTQLMDWIINAENQSEIIFEGFTSSSSSKDVVIDFAKKHAGRKNNETDVLLVIKGKSGRPIEKLSQFSGRFEGKPNQHEIVFDKKKRFRLISNEEISGICTRKFVLEEV